jgi:hypothetical protein
MPSASESSCPWFEMKSQLSDIPVEYVHIDTPKDECLQRLESDPERQPLA